MFSAVQSLDRVLNSTVETDGFHLLVLRASDVEIVPVLQRVQALDARDSHDIVLWTDAPFVNPQLSADSLVERVGIQRDQVNALLVARGEAPWPELPTTCMDSRVAPASRIALLTHWIVERLPRSSGHRVVLALIPSTIAHYDVWRALVVSLLQTRVGDSLEWLSHTRLIVREDTACSPFPVEPDRRDTTVHTTGFDTDSLLNALARDAVDRSIPLQLRLQFVLQLGLVDVAYSRFQEAADKFLLVANLSKDDPGRLSMAFDGMGRLQQVQGRHQEACAKFCDAIATLEVNPEPGLLLNPLLGLVQSTIALEKWDEALQWVEQARALAEVIPHGVAAADLDEQRGVILQRKGRIGDAARAWEQCAERCVELHYQTRGISALERLKRIYTEAHQTDRVRLVEEKLRAMEALKQ